MKDVRDITDFRDSYCSAILQRHERKPTLIRGAHTAAPAVYSKQTPQHMLICGGNTAATISVSQYVLNLISGKSSCDTPTVLNLWKNVRANMENNTVNVYLLKF